MDSLLGASPPPPPNTLGPDEMENRRGRTAPSACTPRTHPVCVGVCVCVFGVCVCVRARVRYCGECAARTWQPAQSTHSDAGRPEGIRASMRSAAMYTHRYAHSSIRWWARQTSMRYSRGGRAAGKSRSTSMPDRPTWQAASQHKRIREKLPGRAQGREWTDRL